MLAPSQKTAVALTRALFDWEDKAHLLVLDEPTASLPGADVERLFSAIQLLKERGVAILYVSHHLDEVFEIADDVSGAPRRQACHDDADRDLDHNRLIELMIGHKLERVEHQLEREDRRNRRRLSVESIRGGTITNLDLTVRPGEVVGVAGITGSGRELVAPFITGQTPSDAGNVVVCGTPLPNYDPNAAIQAGLAFVPADRASQGIIPLESVSNNLTLADVGRNWRGGRLRHAEERAETGVWIDRLQIKTAGTEIPIGALSGGNQQKVLFGRSLRLDATGARARRTDEWHRRQGQGTDPATDRRGRQQRSRRSRRLDRHRRTRPSRPPHRHHGRGNGRRRTQRRRDDDRERRARPTPIHESDLSMTMTDTTRVRRRDGGPGRHGDEEVSATTSWVHRIGLDKFSGLYLLGAFFIFFGLTESNFLIWNGSIEFVLTQEVIVVLLALAFLVPLTTGTFDLSIGATMALSLVIVNKMALETDLPDGVGALVGMAACLAIGAINGFIVVKLRGQQLHRHTRHEPGDRRVDPPNPRRWQHHQCVRRQLHQLRQGQPLLVHVALVRDA